MKPTDTHVPLRWRTRLRLPEGTHSPEGRVIWVNTREPDQAKAELEALRRAAEIHKVPAGKIELVSIEPYGC